MQEYLSRLPSDLRLALATLWTDPFAADVGPIRVLKVPYENLRTTLRVIPSNVVKPSHTFPLSTARSATYSVPSRQNNGYRGLTGIGLSADLGSLVWRLQRTNPSQYGRKQGKLLAR
jgi:hypothetical protein